LARSVYTHQDSITFGKRENFEPGGSREIVDSVETLAGGSTRQQVHVLHQHERSEPRTGATSFFVAPSLTSERLSTFVHVAASIDNDPYQLGQPQELYSFPLATDIGGLARQAMDTVRRVCDEQGVRFGYAEFFLSHDTVSVLSSVGHDQSYGASRLDVEIAVLNEGRDSLYYVRLDARDLNGLHLEHALRDVAQIVKARREQHGPQEYEGPIVLVGPAARDFFGVGLSGSPFSYHSSLANIYNDDTSMQRGDSFADGSIRGDTLDIVLDPNIAYGVGSGHLTPLGARTRRLEIVKDSSLVGVHGGVRHAAYLGETPTGFGNVVVGTGTTNYNDLCADNALVIYDFAGYQVDPKSGNVSTLVSVGKRIGRGGSTFFTGGFLQFDYGAVLQDLTLSHELQVHGAYRGPQAVRFEQARLTGKTK
jgi:predicted Zn-dependent protease